MASGPGDELAAGAAAGGDLRASHADREQAIEALKAVFTRGMLAKDESFRRGRPPPGRQQQRGPRAADGEPPPPAPAVDTANRHRRPRPSM